MLFVLASLAFSLEVTVNKEHTSEGSSLVDALTKSGLAFSDITEIHIKNGIISNDDFNNISDLFPYLETFTVEESVQKSEDITNFDFGYHSNIKSVTFPQLGVLQEGCFECCTSLEIASFKNIVIIYDHCFCNCTGLHTIDMPKLKILRRNDDGYHFAFCHELKSFNFSQLTRIEGDCSFLNCTSLTSINFPNLQKISGKSTFSDVSITIANFSKLMIVSDSLFENCDQLTDFVAPLVRIIGPSAFSNCISLISIDFGSIKKIGEYSFKNCHSLTSISSDTVSEIGKYAFSNCDSLITAEFIFAETIFDNAFDGCTKLNYLNITRCVNNRAAMLRNANQIKKLDVGFHEVLSHQFEDTNIEQIEMKSCVVIREYGFSKSKLSSIRFPEIRVIEQRCFFENTNLKEIEMPRALLGLSYINGNNFEGYYFALCSSLENVQLPEMIDFTGKSGFEGCTLLNNIDIPRCIRFNNNFFNNCQSLNNVTLQSVAYIDKMFDGCSSLQYIDFPSATVLVQDSFNSCSSIIEVKMNKVMNIEAFSFKQCTNLKYGYFENVRRIMQEAFFQCSNLLKIDAKKLTELLYTSSNKGFFEGCTSLQEIDFPNLTMINGKYAFYKCYSLEKANIPKCSQTSSNTFRYDNNLKYLYMNSLGFISDYMTSNCDSLKIINLDRISSLPSSMFSGLSGLIEISMNNCYVANRNAFYNCKQLQKISAERLLMIYCECFRNCNSLVEVSFPKLVWARKSGSADGKIFQSCTSLKKLHLPNLVEIEYSYFCQYCSSLTDLNLNNLRIGGYAMFDQCTSLTRICLPNCFSMSTYSFNSCTSLVYAELTNMGYVNSYTFNNCINLVEFHGDEVERIEERAFSYCSKLNEANFPYVKKISINAFLNCSRLTKVNLPNLRAFDGESVFENCDALSSISLPECHNIKEKTFKNCISLYNVDIPKVVSLGNNAFYGCSSIKKLEIPKTYDVDVNLIAECSSLEEFSAPAAIMQLSTFINLPNLKKYNIPSMKYIEKGGFENCAFKSFDLPNVIYIRENGFKNCTNAESYNLPNARVIGTIGEDVGYQFFDNIKLEKISLPKIVHCGRSLFSGCTSLKEVDLPLLSKTWINVFFGTEIRRLELPSLVQMNKQIFGGMSSIETLVLPKLVMPIESTTLKEFSSLKTFIAPNMAVVHPSLFESCAGLEEVQLDTCNLFRNKAFTNCKLLKTLNAPKLITIQSTNNIFAGCSSLKSIDFPEFVAVVGSGAFRECNIKTANLPKVIDLGTNTFTSDLELEQINAPLLTYAKSAFGSTNVSELIFPKLVKVESGFLSDNAKIKKVSLASAVLPSNMFMNQALLEEVELPNVVELQESAFNGCSFIKKISLPSLISLEGNSHFSSCSSLTEINMPNLKASLSSNQNLILNCNSLSTVFLGSYPPCTFNENTFVNSGSSATVLLPKLSDYKIYDDNTMIAGDVSDDGMWCGIKLAGLSVKIIINSITEKYGSSIDDAASTFTDTITSIKVEQGYLKTTDFIDSSTQTLAQRYPSLTEFIISENCRLVDEIPEASLAGASLTNVVIDPLTEIKQTYLKGITTTFTFSSSKAIAVGYQAFIDLKVSNVQLPNVLSIDGECFKNCAELSTVSLLVMTEIKGTGNFYGCTSLTDIAFPSLLTIQSSNNLFEDCTGLLSLGLPSVPPEKFGSVFDSFTSLNLILPKYEDYFVYDDDLYGSDVANDKKWRGITLSQIIFGMRINDGDPIFGSSYADALTKRTDSAPITKIEITNGEVKAADFTEIKKTSTLEKFLTNERVTIADNKVPDEAFKGLISLSDVSIYQAATIGKSCFEGCQSLKKIFLPDVVEVLERAFFQCAFTNLTRENFPAIMKMQQYSLYECSLLTEFSIGLELAGDYCFGKTGIQNWTAPLKQCGKNVFEYCSSLVAAKFPTLESMGASCFFKCDNLVSVELVVLKIVTSFAFSSLPKLETIKADQVTSIDDNSFSGCSSLKSVKFESLTSIIGKANFKDCVLLENVTLFKLEAIDPTNNDIFSGCTSLKRLELGSIPPKTFNNQVFQNLNVEIILPSISDYYTYDEDISVTDDVFADAKWCGIRFDFIELTVKINDKADLLTNSIKNAVVRNSLTDDYVTSIIIREGNLRASELIDPMMSLRYKNLISFAIDLPLVDFEIPDDSFSNHPTLEKIDFQGVKKIGKRSFMACHSLEVIKLDSVEEIEADAFRDCQSLVTIEASNLTTLGHHAFTECIELKVISLEKIETISFWCFGGCYNLSSLTFPLVMTIEENAFYGCDMIESISFESITSLPSQLFADSKYLKTIHLPCVKELGQSAFSGCVSLENVSLPSVETLGNNAFTSCKNLHSFYAAKLKTISNNVFMDCESLETIEIHSIQTIGDYCFQNCVSLTDIDFPTLKTTGKYTFNGCINIETIQLIELTAFGISSFENLTNLTKIVIPKVTSLPNKAFMNCINLETTDFSSVTTIYDDFTFANCESIKEVHLEKLKTLDKPIFIFLNCVNLSLIYLGSNPASTFNQNTFINRNSEHEMIFKVPVIEDYFNYDNSVAIPGDVAGDQRWCGLHIPVKFLIFQINDIEVKSFNFEAASEAAGYYPNSEGQYSDVTKIHVVNGKLENDLMIVNNRNMADRYPSLEIFSFSNDLIVANLLLPAKSFKGALNLHTVLLPNIVTLENECFMGCIKLKTHDILKLVKIGDHVFDGCSVLESLDLKSLTSCGEYAFANCPLLSTVKIPKVETLYGHTFENDVVLGSFDMTGAITIHEYCFAGCVAFNNPYFNVITLIGDSHFSGCVNLASIKLLKLKTVESTAANIFKDCSQLNSISLPSTPPKAFSNLIFVNRNSETVIDIVLPNFNDYYTYDNDESIEGDEAGDCKWCGISFYSKFGLKLSVNDLPPQSGNTLDFAIRKSGITDMNSVISIDIQEGQIYKSDIQKMGNRYPKLELFKMQNTVSIYNKVFPEGCLSSSSVRDVYLYGVVTFESSALYNCKNLKLVVAPDLRNTGQSVFSSCTSLEEVNLDIVSTSMYGFGYCYMLSRVNLPKLQNIAQYLFYTCTSLTEINFPECQSISRYSFSDSAIKVMICPKLSYIATYALTIPTLTTISFKSLTSLDLSSIQNAPNLVDVDIPKLRDIGSSAFSYCSSLKTVDFPEVTIVRSSAFYYCTSLVNITFNNIEYVDNYAFQGCRSLTSASFENAQTVYKYGLSGCSSLADINIPQVSTIREYGFESCSSLSELEIPNINSIYNNAFQSCTSLENVSFENANSVGVECFKDCTNLKIVSLDKLSSVGRSIFTNCNKLEIVSFAILNSVADSTFDGIISLKSVNIPKAKSIGKYAFRNTKLDHLELLSCTTIDESAFHFCRNLKSIKAPLLTRTGLNAFASCEQLEVGEFPELSDIGSNCFADCSNLEKLIVSEDLAALNNGVFKNCRRLKEFDASLITKIGQEAFMNCESIEELNLSSITFVNQSSFKGSGLVNVELPLVTIIHSEAFKFCESLASIDAPMLTELEGNGHFANCSMLSDVNFPALATVDPQYDDIFEYCINFTNIHLNANPPDRFNPSTFTNTQTENVINVILPVFDDYYTYDNSEIYINNGDQANDKKWCGVVLTELFTVANINNNGIQVGENLAKCVQEAEISDNEVTSIRIIRGILELSDLYDESTTTSIAAKYPNLESFSTPNGLHMTSYSLPENSFSGAANLKEVNLGSFKEILGNAFLNCVKLEKVILLAATSFDSTSFSGCVALREITTQNVLVIPSNSFNGLANLQEVSMLRIQEIQENAFKGCKSLTRISFNNLRTLTGTGQFEDCENLEFVSLGSNYVNNLAVESTNSNLFSNCKKLNEIALGRKPPRTMNKDTFKNRNSQLEMKLTVNSLETLVAYDNDVSIDGDESEDAKWCGILLREIATVVKVNNLVEETGNSLVKAIQRSKETEVNKVEVIDGKLESKDFENNILTTTFAKLKEFVVSSNIDMKFDSLPSKSFANHPTLEHVEFPNIISIVNDCFRGCAALKSVNMTDIKIIPENSFDQIATLTEVHFPSTTELRQNAFRGCSSLSDVDAPEVLEIGLSVFEGCLSLLILEMPKLRSIPANSFKNLNLKRCNFDSSSNALESSFENCRSLEEINIRSVVSLGRRCFTNCEKLIELVCPNLVTLDEEIFLGCSGLQRVDFALLTYLHSNEFENHFELIEVLIPKLSTIGSKTFFGCKKLCQVSFPVMKSMNDYSFAGCEKLENVSLPVLDIIGVECFIGCNSLEFISLPMIPYVPVKTFYQLPVLEVAIFDSAEYIDTSALESCIMLINVTIPLVTSLRDRCFMKCESLEFINVSNVTSMMSSVFEGCISLLSIDIPELDEAGERCFFDCISMKSADVPVLDLIPPEFFKNCISLTEIDFSNTSTIDDSCFYNCSSMEVFFADSVVIMKGSQQFAKCSSMKTLYMRNITETEKSNDNIFMDCSLLETLYLPSNPPKTFSKNTFVNRHSSITPVIILPEWDDYYTYDNNVDIEDDEWGDTFWCGIQFKPLITTVIVNEGQEITGNALGPAVIRSVSQTSSATKIEVIDGKLNGTDFVTLNGEIIKDLYPNLEVFSIRENVRVQLEANNVPNSSFADHSKLIEVNLPQIESIGSNCFSYSTALKIVRMSKVREIFTDTFIGCTSIEKVYIESVTEIPEDVFMTLANLVEVHCPSVKEICFKSFYQCSSLISVDAPDLEIIGNQSFAFCMSLLIVNYSSVSSVSESAFEGCSSLTNVEFSSLEEIGESKIFKDCAKLENIVLPSLKTVGNETIDLLKSCIEMKTIELPSIPPQVFNKDTFADCTKIVLVLPELIDYFVYDNNTQVEEDVSGDCKWCGIKLPNICHSVMINNEVESHGNTLEFAVTLAGLSIDDVMTLEVDGGIFFEWDWKSLKSFANMEKLVLNNNEIKTIPENSLSDLTQTVNITIYSTKIVENSAFSGCTSLKYAYLENVEEIHGDNHFAGCESLEIVSLPSIKQFDNGAQTFKDCINLKQIILGSTIPVNVNKDLFISCKDTVKLILPEDADYYTYDNSKLIDGDEEGDCHWCGIYISKISRKIIVNDQKAEGNSIEHALKRSNIAANDVNSLSLLEGEFYVEDLNKISQLVVNLKTFKVENGAEFPSNELPRNMFKDHARLKSVILNKLLNIGDSCFEKCSKLSELTMVVNVRAEEIKPVIGSRSFYECSDLMKMYIPEVREVGEDCFVLCSNLNDIDFSSLSKINGGSFRSCTSIQVLELDSLSEISGNDQFAGCSSLTNISMPSLKVVDKTANNIFADCVNLQSIELGSVPPKTFHKDTFVNRRSAYSMTLILPNDEDYESYDNTADIEGDSVGDHKWCGIQIIAGIINKESPEIPPNEEVPPKEEDSNLAVIIGATVGSIVLVIIIVAVVIYVIKRKKEKPSTSSFSSMSHFHETRDLSDNL